jgi:hypothetical protein
LEYWEKFGRVEALGLCSSVIPVSVLQIWSILQSASFECVCSHLNSDTASSAVSQLNHLMGWDSLDENVSRRRFCSVKQTNGDSGQKDWFKMVINVMDTCHSSRCQLAPQHHHSPSSLSHQIREDDLRDHNDLVPTWLFVSSLCTKIFRVLGLMPSSKHE